jgi:hypothetical protein
MQKLRVAVLIGLAIGMAGSLSACFVELGHEHGWRHEHRDWR